jgi:hypothetical protein
MSFDPIPDAPIMYFPWEFLPLPMWEHGGLRMGIAVCVLTPWPLPSPTRSPEPVGLAIR